MEMGNISNRHKRRVVKSAVEGLQLVLIPLLMGVLCLCMFGLIGIENPIKPKQSVPEVVVQPEEVPLQEAPEVPDEPEVPVISAYGPSDSYYYQLSEEEVSALTKMVYAECRGEPFVGQVAVAATALNRLNEGRWGTTMQDVVNAPSQFATSSWVTEEMLARYPQCAEAVDQALRGYDPTRKEFPEGALYFWNSKKTSSKYAEARIGITMMTEKGIGILNKDATTLKMVAKEPTEGLGVHWFHREAPKW